MGVAGVAGVAGVDGCHLATKDSKIAHTAGYNAVVASGDIPPNFKFTLEVLALLAPTTSSRESACVDCSRIAGNLPDNPINLINLIKLCPASPVASQTLSDLYAGGLFGVGDPTPDDLMLVDRVASTAYYRAKGGLLPLAAQPLGAKASGPPVATRADNTDTLCADGADNSAPASLADISKFISGAGPYAMLSVAGPLVQLDVAGLHVVDLAAKDNAGIRRRVAPRGKPMLDKFLGEEIVDCCRRSMVCVRHTIQALNCMPNPVAVRTACKLIDLADSMLLHTALLTVDRLALTPTKANHLALSAAEEVARDAEKRRTGLEDTISRLQELLEELETRATKVELLLVAQEAEIVGLRAMVKQAREAEKQALANTVCMLEVMKAQKAKPKSRKDSKKTTAETPQKSAETAPQPSATPALGLAKSRWAPGQVQEPHNRVVLLDRDACKLLPDPFPLNTAARWASINKHFPDCAALPQEVQRAIDYTHTVKLRTFKNCMDTNFMFKNISCIAGGGSTCSNASQTFSKHSRRSRPLLSPSMACPSSVCTTTRAASTSATSGMRTLQRLAFAASTPWRACRSKAA
jgi:hypothetical protein